MPLLDRFWWLRALWALVPAAGAAAVLWFLVTGLAALEGLDDPGLLALILLYAIVFVCLCAGYAAYCA